MSTVKPLGKRVLIKRNKVTQTKGGIILPETAQEKPKEGTVVAVGPGKLDDNGKIDSMNLKVGDRILFSSYAGTEVKDPDNSDDELLIMNEDEIFGVLT